MISTKSETPIDFDMNQVVEKNKDNPVFYCQYAFARASSVIRKANLSKEIPSIYESLDLLSINYIIIQFRIYIKFTYIIFYNRYKYLFTKQKAK